MNRGSEKEMMRAFTEFTKYFKSRGINPGFHSMDNEGSTALKMTISTMDIKYKLVPPSNHRVKNQREQFKPSRKTS